MSYSRCVNSGTNYSFGDHFQTCQVKSVSSQSQDWVVYRLGGILGLVGHRVKVNKITSATGKERGDREIKDDAPEFDGTLRVVVRKKIIHYRQLSH